jgi:CDP-diacylglycerol---serine O-phosphatidyltransferase
MKKQIPNFITILNLLSGCVGLWLIRMGEMEYACYMIFIAAVFDFLDGFVARALKAYSEIGKQLDSLADMVTFGVLPGMIMTEILRTVVEIYDMPSALRTIVPCVGFILTAFSCIRLAKFNIDTRQTDVFLGLPTPMNAIFIASLPLILFMNVQVANDIILNLYVLLAIILINSFLMISELPLMALNFRSFSFKDNTEKYIFLIASVILILLMKMMAVPFIFILYILISLIARKRNEIQS